MRPCRGQAASAQGENHDTSQAGTPGRFRAGALRSVPSVHMACSPNNCASTQPPTSDLLAKGNTDNSDLISNRYALRKRGLASVPQRDGPRAAHNGEQPIKRYMRYSAYSVHSRCGPRMLAEPPMAALLIEVLQTSSLPPSPAPTATGWSDSCRAGFAPAEEWRLGTAHVKSGLDAPSFVTKLR